MTGEIPAETVARMVDHFRRVAAKFKDKPDDWDGSGYLAEIRAILATLPEPVPADLLAAREWAKEKWPKGHYDIDDYIEAHRAGWAARDGVGQ